MITYYSVRDNTNNEVIAFDNLEDAEDYIYVEYPEENYSIVKIEM